MLGEALGDLVADSRRSGPDLVTNIRTLGGGRNREIIAQIQTGRERILVLVKIMRNFTLVKNTQAVPPKRRPVAAPVVEAPPPPGDPEKTGPPEL
jgi:hypothetical protein